MTHPINLSGAKYSAIVSIGEKLKKKSIEEKRDYLYLNRGINQVVNIDLEAITKNIDFNSNQMQYYPPGRGALNLKQAVNKHFFMNAANEDNIFITGGGMYSLHLALGCLKQQRVYTPNLFWGAYRNLIKIAGKTQHFYPHIEHLAENPEHYSNSIVIICDPNNPSGEKAPDELILKAVRALSRHGISLIWDGPYRKLFTDENDRLFSELLRHEHVIISESFSKSVGLSGQRVGFMHSSDTEFNKEFSVRLLFSGNGINAFAQELIARLLNTDMGTKAVKNFRKATTAAISKNIHYLQERELLAKELYRYDSVWGIFVILNRSQHALEAAAIGSVGLNYFTKDDRIDTSRYARVCVSVPHERFKSFFEKLS